MNKILTIILLFSFTANAKKTPNLEQMWIIIQQQQKAIEKLQDKLNRNIENVDHQNKVIEVISDNIDNTTLSSQSKYKFGGYGELHYGNTDKGNNIDFHRFVLFNGYDFNENTRFYSELEIEHALSGDGKPGEVEVEQAFIEHKFNNSNKMTIGISLLPIGIINETHEPNTFYGVERNNVEKNIIPATWWAAGIGFSQKVNDRFSYDIYVGEGLNVQTSGSKAFLIRSGRQKAAKAKANDGSITARIKFNPVTNLQLNASIQYQQDITQGDLGIDATLFETNLQYNINGFALKALYANWDLDKSVNTIIEGREQQKGYYIEPSYRFGQSNQYGIYTRYSMWDSNAGNDNSDDAIKQLDLGFNYWLTPKVVLKADYQDQHGRNEDDGLNLGMGYSF